MNEERYIKKPYWLMADKSMSPLEKDLWVLLYERNHYFSENGMLHYDTLVALADMLGVTDKTIERSLKMLVESGRVKARKVALLSMDKKHGKLCPVSDGKKGGAMKWVFDNVAPVVPEWNKKPQQRPATPKPVIKPEPCDFSDLEEEEPPF